jgi:hypothetical protein
MNSFTRYSFWLLIGVLFFTSITWAAQAEGGIIPGQYSLVPVDNHMPEAFKNVKSYWSSLQKVELEIGNQEQFKDLPDIKMKKPFTGTIVLGDKLQKFGVIVDIAGDEKRLYVDRKGSGSFAGETWVPLLNEWEGLQIYSVRAPEPITLQVGYNCMQNQVYPIEISIMGMVNKPGLFYKEKPYLLVEVRTWFLAKLNEDDGEKMVAIVDANNKGIFNDPKDFLFIDNNDNGFFSSDEAIVRHHGVNIKNGKRKFAFNWDAYPDKLTVEEVK